MCDRRCCFPTDEARIVQVPIQLATAKASPHQKTGEVLPFSAIIPYPNCAELPLAHAARKTSSQYHMHIAVRRFCVVVQPSLTMKSAASDPKHGIQLTVSLDEALPAPTNTRATRIPRALYKHQVGGYAQPCSTEAFCGGSGALMLYSPKLLIAPGAAALGILETQQAKDSPTRRLFLHHLVHKIAM